MAFNLSSAPICNLPAQRQTTKVLSSVFSCKKAIRAMTSSTIPAPQRKKDPRKRVVITGMGLVSVFGSNINAFYDRLLAGESGITLISHFDASDLPVRIAGWIHDFSAEGYVDADMEKHMDRTCQYCLVAGQKALEDANLGPEVIKTLDRTRIGALVGSGIGGSSTCGAETLAYLTHGYKKISPHFIHQYATNASSATLAIDAGLMGINYSISAACATSNYCFYAAANHIRNGEADIILAGGTEAGITRHGLSGFIACRALSQNNNAPQCASRPWDKDRDGFIMGEGCGVLVMESLEHAIMRGANIIAEYLGGALTCDAYHMTDPRPDGLSVSACIVKALENAGVSPEEVNYVNAHATSTQAGDLAEIMALKKVFKDTTGLKMNATKSMIGHALGASGALEAIATIKAIETGWLHPTVNQHNLEPEVTIGTVPNKAQKHEVNIAISNAFGFGGQNSVIVFAPFRL